MRLKGEARKQALAKTQAAAERIRAAGYEVVKVTPTRIKLGPIVLGEDIECDLSDWMDEE